MKEDKKKTGENVLINLTRRLTTHFQNHDKRTKGNLYDYRKDSNGVHCITALSTFYYQNKSRPYLNNTVQIIEIDIPTFN